MTTATANKIVKQGKFYLGKVDYNGSGRKNCKAILEYELRETDNGLEFSAQGEIWNPRETDIYFGGQCVDKVAAFPGAYHPKAKRLVEIWQRWHLNGMNAGSKAQEDYLREHPLDPESYRYPKSHYEAASEYLKQAGLNPDADGYMYGHAWKHEPLPQAIVDEIMSW